MGNSQSIVSKEKLSSMTHNTRYVMDKILQYMLKELHVRDFVNMSDDTECKKYVLFKANMLYKYFYELEIMPTRDKRGVISFRKFEDIKSADKKQGASERKSLCLMIAYYYTRIFQIYGALALTLIDDAEMSSDFVSDSLVTPGRPGYVREGYVRKEQRGGTLSESEIVKKLSGFSRLSRLIDSNSNEHTRYGLKLIYTDKRIKSIYFKVDQKGGSKEYGIFSIFYGTGTYRIILKISIDINNPITNILKIGECYYEKTTKKIEIKNKQIEIKENTDNSIIQSFFDKIFERISDTMEDSSDTYTERGVESEKTGVTSKLKIESTIKKIEKRENYGHCVARALQLLKTIQMDGSLCDAKFQTTPFKSIPYSKFDDSYGLPSLAILFYDTIQNATINIGVKPGPNGRSSFEEYTQFMKKMSTLFEGKEEADKRDFSKLKLENLSNKRDPELCKLTGDKSFKIDPSTKTKVNSNVNKLFQIQYQHAIKCGSIFNQLFNIQNDNGFKISLHNNILNKGFVELDRINRLTRQVLVDYYSNCETEYLQGVQTIINANKARQPKVQGQAQVQPKPQPKPQAQVQAQVQAQAQAQPKVQQVQQAQQVQPKQKP